MNEYWKEQAGLTPDEKQAFVDKAKADEARFLQSLRKITDSADNRMLTRVARERSGGTDDDADDAIQSAKFSADYKDSRGRLQKCCNIARGSRFVTPFKPLAALLFARYNPSQPVEKLREQDATFLSR